MQYPRFFIYDALNFKNPNKFFNQDCFFNKVLVIVFDAVSRSAFLTHLCIIFFGTMSLIVNSNLIYLKNPCWIRLGGASVVLETIRGYPQILWITL